MFNVLLIFWEALERPICRTYFSLRKFWFVSACVHSEPLLFARRHSTPSSPWEGGRTEGSWKIFMIIVCCSRCAALCLNGGKSVGFRQTNAEMQFCYVKVGSFLNIFIISTEFRLHFCLCKRFHVEFLKRLIDISTELQYLI